MKYLQNDFEERIMTSEEMLTEYLEFRKKNDIWCKPAVNETSVVGLGISADPGEADKDVQIPDDVRRAAMADNRLLFAFPYNFMPTIMPIRYTAFPDICNRAGLKGRTIESFTPKTNISVLDPVVKAYFLSTGLSLNAYECNVLIRDEKVSSVKSNEYKIFPEYELIDLLKAELSRTWENFTFKQAAVSHEYLTTSYLLNATDMEESFRLRLEDMGVVTVPTIKAGVQLATSDVGNSAVSIATFYEMDGVRVYLGAPLKIRHDKGKTLNDVAEAFKKIASIFREAEDEIEVLGNTDIKYPADCLLNIVDEFTLPKTVAKDVAATMQKENATALDVYIALNEIVEKHYKTSKMTLTSLIEMSETVARLMTFDFSRFDLPAENE